MNSMMLAHITLQDESSRASVYRASKITNSDMRHQVIFQVMWQFESHWAVRAGESAFTCMDKLMSIELPLCVERLADANIAIKCAR
jgi:hypothetical protein